MVYFIMEALTIVLLLAVIVELSALLVNSRRTCEGQKKSGRKESEKKLDDIQKNVVMSFADIIEKRDDTTGKHVKRTSAYVRILANELKERGIYGIDEDYVEKISNAAPLHDVGKIAISDTILNKPGRLTDEEFEKIKEHPVVGREMLETVLREVSGEEYQHIAYDIALCHHEKWDGSGYPNGIAGEEIPLSARIMAVADVFDALVSQRCYKDAFSYETAFQIIKDSSGTHFDPVLVDAFLGRKEEIKVAG